MCCAFEAAARPASCWVLTDAEVSDGYLWRCQTVLQGASLGALPGSSLSSSLQTKRLPSSFPFSSARPDLLPDPQPRLTQQTRGREVGPPSQRGVLRLERRPGPRLPQICLPQLNSLLTVLPALTAKMEEPLLSATQRGHPKNLVGAVPKLPSRALPSPEEEVLELEKKTQLPDLQGRLAHEAAGGRAHQLTWLEDPPRLSLHVACQSGCKSQSLPCTCVAEMDNCSWTQPKEQSRASRSTCSNAGAASSESPPPRRKQPKKKASCSAVQ